MAPTISQLRSDGPSKMGNCQVSWSINNECISLKGVATSFVPAISILPPTPVKNKGKGKETPDDNQEDIFLADLHLDSLMVHNDESGRLKHGRERSGTGDVRGSKTHRRSASHSTAPTVPSTDLTMRAEQVKNQQVVG